MFTSQLMLVGYVLLVSPCGHDSCDAVPVTETIYTKDECTIRLNYLKKKRPDLYIFCGEVLRDPEVTDENPYPTPPNSADDVFQLK
ncbi:TPA: hypothetical protein SMR89_000421 [Proteus mirabilis]|nr:hypothetical protein [Proteus mirabilis]